MALRVGLVGCGNISEIYFANAALFRDFEIVACADIVAEAARAKAERWGVSQRGVDALLGSADVDIVLNLTIPAVHAEVSMSALAAGKHVYSEKPLATSLGDGQALVAEARRRGLRIGCAPDTVLGGGVQEARRRIDGGEIGRLLIGTATVLGHGMEMWHPNPSFFFKAGGGPVLDMGPYYLATLVTLLGPATHVAAMSQSGFAERVVTAEQSPVRGQRIPVETPTSVQAIIQFAGGAQITFLASWDVWAHGQLPLELHGTEASIRIPDPNWFGGDLAIGRPSAPWETVTSENHRFGRMNWPADSPWAANYRGLGLADMARGIRDGRPHRANGDVGLHVLAIMLGMLQAAEEGRVVPVAHGCERPAPLADAEALELLA